MTGKAYFAALTPLLVILCLSSGPASGNTGSDAKTFLLEIEPGIVIQSRNDIQIPNTAEGTRFSLYDLAGNAARPAVRVYLSWRFSEKQGIRLLYAPLTIKEDITPGGALSFAGGEFEGGVPASATYKFNSYRVTWYYRFYSGDRSRWNIGFTAKIRDAIVKIDQGGSSASKSDVGFVPLLHLSGRIGVGKDYFILADLDALAGGPGRAEDLSVRIGKSIGERILLSAGYRMVEGGADVEEVYSFAWLHYFVISLGIAL